MSKDWRRIRRSTPLTALSALTTALAGLTGLTTLLLASACGPESAGEGVEEARSAVTASCNGVPDGTPCASDGNPCTIDRCSGGYCGHDWVAGGCMDNPDPTEGVDRAWYGWTPIPGLNVNAPVAVVATGHDSFEVYSGSSRAQVRSGIVGAWESMAGGGPDTSTPAVVRTSDRGGASASSMVFVGNALGEVWWRRFADVDADSTFWQALPFCNTTLASGGRPSLTLRGDTLEVMGITAGGDLCHTRLTRNGSSAQWVAQPSALLGKPGAGLLGSPSAVEYQGDVRAYVIGHDSYLYERALSGGGFTRISKEIDIFTPNLAEIGGVRAAADLAPAAVAVPADGRVHVFAQGDAEPWRYCTWWNARPPNDVRHVQYPSNNAPANHGGFGPAYLNRSADQISDSLGNLIQGGPVVVSTGPQGQNVQLFAYSTQSRGIDRYSLVARPGAPGDWSAWQSIGGKPAYRPAVSARPDGSLDIVAVDASGAVYTKYLPPAPEQGASLSTGAVLSAIPTLSPRPAERTVIIVPHLDDDTFFIAREVERRIDAGDAVLTVLMGGDEGVMPRELGSRNAYATMRGVENRWTDHPITFAGRTATLRQLDGDPRIMELILRIQSSSECNGTGLCSQWQSGPSRAALVQYLRAVLAQFEPTRLFTLDPHGWFGAGTPDAVVGSHLEHQVAALFARDAVQAWNPAVKPEVAYFRDYNNMHMPAVAGRSERWAKARANQALVFSDAGQEKWNNNSGWYQVNLQSETTFLPRNDQERRRLLAVGAAGSGCLRATQSGNSVELAPCTGDGSKEDFRFRNDGQVELAASGKCLTVTPGTDAWAPGALMKVNGVWVNGGPNDAPVSLAYQPGGAVALAPCLDRGAVSNNATGEGVAYQVGSPSDTSFRNLWFLTAEGKLVGTGNYCLGFNPTSHAAVVARCDDASAPTWALAAQASAGLPKTCQEIRAANPAAGDGSYTLFLGHDGAKPWQAYCRDMAGTPREYLSLRFTGEQSNFSQYTQGGNTPGLNVRTYFRRIRIDPDSLLVDITDLSDATTVYDESRDFDSAPSSRPSGCSAEHPCPQLGVTQVQAMGYASAADCDYDFGRHGVGQVDLRLTPFSVDPGAFFPIGANPNGSAAYSEGDQVVQLTGGGACGWNAPQGFLPLIPFVGGSNFVLQLHYTHPVPALYAQPVAGPGVCTSVTFND